MELSEEDNDVALGAVAALTYAYKNDAQAKAMFVERLTAEVFQSLLSTSVEILLLQSESASANAHYYAAVVSWLLGNDTDKAHEHISKATRSEQQASSMVHLRHDLQFRYDAFSAGAYVVGWSYRKSHRAPTAPSRKRLSEIKALHFRSWNI